MGRGELSYSVTYSLRFIGDDRHLPGLSLIDVCFGPLQSHDIGTCYAQHLCLLSLNNIQLDFLDEWGSWVDIFFRKRQVPFYELSVSSMGEVGNSAAVR